jgi:predicted O-methyltransferase YrrM
MTASPDELKFMPIWEACKPFTMTSFERGYALYRAIHHIVEMGLPGSFVECGVWRGGSSMIAMMTLKSLGHANRPFYLLDTFDGMTEAGEKDVDHDGQSAQTLMQASEGERKQSLLWAYADTAEVLANFRQVGYPSHLVNIIKGDVRKTLPSLEIGAIALLRLDTDFYDSTLAELVYLYPKLVENGILLIDDYGHWQGARLAVDEYFDGLVGQGDHRPMLQRIDYTGRIAVRSYRAPPPISLRYDYKPPGLKRSNMLDHFPSLVRGDPNMIPWPYLRKEVPHIWRSDSRSVRHPQTGVLSLEEAEIIYNNALLFKGRRGLEIGCYFGWSAAHLRAAGLQLDLIDPEFNHADQLTAVKDSLSKVKTKASLALWAGYSPSIVPAVRATQREPWAFVFIDGYHEGSAPQLDARAVAPLCAKDACVMFHDLTSPFVANGLREMANAGWKVGLYNTMQIMGIAWRGKVSPVKHVSDPNIIPVSHAHLAEFQVLSI